ncbi:Glutamate synthase [NADPH] small chain [subsurface metagenome]
MTIFESLHLPGGVLSYGIPEFRLPKEIVKKEIASIEDLGVRIRTDVVLGKTFTIKELFLQGFAAIFVGTGAGLPMFLGIEGEWLNRVYSANEFLLRTNLMKSYLFPEYETPLNVGKRVAVIGGGNVAMDSARAALRLGATVIVFYRRSEREMPARREEYENAREEGIEFHFLVAPVEILDDEKNWVKGIKLIKMKLGSPDSSGRARPVPVKGSEFSLPVDTVVIAIGQRPNPLVPQSTPGLKTGRIGNIIADEETGETNIEGLFAGGDIATGAATVISAMGAGKRTARAIDKYCQKR